jgi:hypothetical protein
MPQHVAAEAVEAESIEWILLDSDWVFTGKVTDVQIALGRDGRKYQAVTVAVDKTLKGKHWEHARFVLRPWQGTVGESWKSEAKPMLFCLMQAQRQKDKAKLPETAWVVREDGNSGSVILLDRAKAAAAARTIPVLTRDFQVLNDPDAILKHIASALADSAENGAPRSRRITVPANTPVFDKLWAEGAVWLTVPVDRRLEEYGRRLCRMPPSLTRAEGASILSHFKNDENIELLKSLLKDESHSIEVTMRSAPGKKLETISRKKVYEVRRSAYDVLREFGVQVERPVLEVPLDSEPSKR